ncbi:MAG: HlyD family type I secretion periplasmic adaptor subunit, partial [Thiomargarita sp.]|nr:HlyD family type I secretion periplasmic adaptor subunit [Thiomargarita sp.]
VAQNSPPFPLGLMVIGIILVILFTGIFVSWTIFAPIKSAVVSPGIVSIAGHRKQIQHLEGGIIEKINVKDGEHVTQGQLLIKLRDVRPAAKLRQLERQYIEIRAIIDRLLAEHSEKNKIKFSQELTEHEQNSSIETVIMGQNNIFFTRKNLKKDKRSVLKHKIAQKEEEVTGLFGRIKAEKWQQKLIKEELRMVNKAIKKNLVPKAKRLKLQQSLAQIDGNLSEYQSEIKRLQQSILEIRLQISEAQAQWISDITEQLREQRALLYDLSQKIIAASDVLRRTEIVSPIDGIVINLKVHTADGVIAAGQPLLEVMPINDKLIVYAYISLEDIDEVRTGMLVDVKFTSFSRRQRVPIKGVVSNLSADRLSDPHSKTEYYRARIELDPDSDVLAKTNLISGMGAEVFIQTGSQTPLNYLLSPLIESLQLGFKEK